MRPIGRNMHDAISNAVQGLRHDIKRFRNTTIQSAIAAQGALDHCDLFLWFVAQRSAAITSEFADAIEQRNHFISPALVRMQLSSLLGLYAANYHEKGAHEFVGEWMNGKAIANMLDNSPNGGKRMTDGHLLERIDQDLPNRVGSIEGLYGAASGWIHLDPRFFYSLTEEIDDDGHFKFRLYGRQFTIPPMAVKDELTWVQSMVSINNLITAKLLSWAACKQEMFGGLTNVDEETGTVEILPLETVGDVNGFEAVLLPQARQNEGAIFSLWINDTKITPKRNLAYVVFPTKEQAMEFANWYIRILQTTETPPVEITE